MKSLYIGQEKSIKDLNRDLNIKKQEIRNVEEKYFNIINQIVL